jgi:hypothetical protein
MVASMKYPILDEESVDACVRKKFILSYAEKIDETHTSGDNNFSPFSKLMLSKHNAVFFFHFFMHYFRKYGKNR